jgi:uncharacterized protein
MKFTLDTPAGLNITACSEAGVTVSGTLYRSSILLLPEEVRAWDCADVDRLDVAGLAPAVEFAPDILLLGSGRSLRFPDAGLTRALARQGIGMEVMDTRAACRTFNVLTAEGRRVIAALIVE